MRKRGTLNRGMVLGILVVARTFSEGLAQPVEPAGGRSAKVEVGDDGALRVDGRPFYPLGLYLGPNEAEDLARIRAAGFNVVLCYSFGRRPTTEARAFLDRALAQKLWVIYSLKDFYTHHKGFPKDDYVDGPTMAIETIVTPLRDHPALLCWYINDEEWPSTKRRNTVLRMYEAVRQADPAHPVFSVVNRVGGDALGFFKGTTDIIGTDPYPLRPESVVQPLSKVTQYVRLARKGYGPETPVWLVPQAFDNGIYGGIASSREPTFAEIRCMTYLGLVEDVKGVLFYSYADCFRRAGRQNEDDPLLFERRWVVMQAIAREMTDLIPALVEGQTLVCDIMADHQKPGGWSAQARARALSVDGTVYLLVANPTARPVQIRVTLPTGRWETRRYLQGGAIKATCDANVIHIIAAAWGADTAVLRPTGSGD